MYNTVNKDVSVNVYQFHGEKFDHGMSADVLPWYNKVWEVIEQKPCQNA